MNFAYGMSGRIIGALLEKRMRRSEFGLGRREWMS
jgi:hypothetical protein